MSPEVLTGAVFVLAVVVLLQMVALLALAQQVGRLRLRLGPAGARTTEAGPPIGARAPAFSVRDQRDRSIEIGGARDQAMLVMFVSPRCVVCRRLIPGLRSLDRTEGDALRVVLVSDGRPEDHRTFLSEIEVGDLPYVRSAEVGIAYEAGMTPYGVLLDPEGVVRAKGLCNHVEHVESLLAAWESGFASVKERILAGGDTPPTVAAEAERFESSKG